MLATAGSDKEDVHALRRFDRIRIEAALVYHPSGALQKSDGVAVPNVAGMT
jgi:hypothetical protein